MRLILGIALLSSLLTILILLIKLYIEIRKDEKIYCPKK